MTAIRATLCSIHCIAMLASCAAPKVQVVVEERERGSASRGGGPAVVPPSLPAMPDDGIRLPSGITAMPDDSVFRRAAPEASAPAQGAVTVRPPGDAEVKPTEEP